MNACRFLIEVQVFLLFFLAVGAFNLETRIPVVKKGLRGSYFGYSVAQHKETNPQNEKESWLLVGAPKGENLQPGTNRSGALFKCPLTTYLEDCQQVQTDGLRDDNGIYDKNKSGRLLPPQKDELKDDQWMGVTLKTQREGGDILVCGHRYVEKSENEQIDYRWGFGLCYRLYNNFSYAQEYQPCDGKPVTLGQEQFGFCQAGSSGTFFEDQIVVGLPGTYNWKGTFMARDTSDPYIYRDKFAYFGDYTVSKKPVEKYSYLGYSVTVGRFFNNEVSYVAGAPRSRGTGQVVFFHKERGNNHVMPYDLILNGHAFASSFGFEVLAMDINVDGLDDLVVSAPFYYPDRPPEASGAVYIYMNRGGPNGISNTMSYETLVGAPGLGDTRFGFSMTSLGDLNLDGFNDLAVGAPYEDRGVVYIYLGSKHGIVKTPSQIIRAEDLPGPAYDAFGYALSGGMDLDGNNYNDLLVSSFCSDRVILLRGRPIIDIQTRVDSENLQNINPTKPGCAENRNAQETCFSFNACFKMKIEGGTRTYLKLRYNISERYYNNQLMNRIRFGRASRERQSSVTKIIQLSTYKTGKYQCDKEIVYVKKEQEDVLRPVRFKLSYEIEQLEPKFPEEGDPMPDIDAYPILNQKEAVRYFEANFAKECGSDEICESDLSIKGDLDLDDGDSEGLYTLELGRRQFFTFSTVIENRGEPAYMPYLYVSHDKAIDLSLTESLTGQYHCNYPTTNKGLLACNLGNPLINSTGLLKLVFKQSGKKFESKLMEFVAWVNSTSQELNPADNQVSFMINVKRKAEISITGYSEPEQVLFSGEIKGESAMTKIEDIGSEIEHFYIVENRGPWVVDELKINFLWPYQVENNKPQGKWLLYMTKIPQVLGGGSCDVDPDFINNLKLASKPKPRVIPEAETRYSPWQTGTSRPPRERDPFKYPGATITQSKNVTTIKKKFRQESWDRTQLESEGETEYESSRRAEFETPSRREYGGSGRTQFHGSSRESSYTGSRPGATSYDSNSRVLDSDSRISSSNGSTRKKNGSKMNFNKRYYTSESRQKSGTFNRVEEETRKKNEERNFNSENTGTNKRVHSRTEQSGIHLTNRKLNEYSDSERLNMVTDIRTVKEGSETYVNGYDDDGKLVWSSRKRQNGQENTNLRTDFSTKSISFGSDGFGVGLYPSSPDQEIKNERDLTEKMSKVVDFRIIKSGNESWVDAYDENKNVVWTTRGSLFDSPSGSSLNPDGGSTSKTGYHRQYSSVEHTVKKGDNPSETRRNWSSTHSDKFGTKSESGSSHTDSLGRRIASEESTDQDFNWDDYKKLVENELNRDNSRSTSYSQTSSIKQYSNPYQSDQSSNFKSNPNPTLHGSDYSRAVVNPKTGDIHVYSQRIFSRKRGNQWEEVHLLPRKEALKESQGAEDTPGWSSQTKKRVKRAREYVIKPEAIVDESSGKKFQVVSFRCDGEVPTAKCFPFQCTIDRLHVKQSIKIRIMSRLWNSTLVEDYSRVSYVSIKSKGSLDLPPEIRSDQDTSDDIAYAETTAYSSLIDQLPAEDVPLWVIILSVLAGLLLLIIIAVVLYKIGFFKRRRPDPTYSGNIHRNGYD